MRTLALSALLLFVPLAVGQAPKPAEPKKATLEDDIANALRGHPDILVADAEARLANAKLQQTKQLVAQKVAAAKREKEKAAEELVLAKRSFEAASLAAAAIRTQIETLQKTPAVPRNEVQQFVATLQSYEVTKLEHERAAVTAKAKLANAEAEYEALVGKSLASGDGRIGWTADATQPFSTPLREWRNTAFSVEYLDSSNAVALPPVRSGSFADQLLAALDKPVKLEAMKNAELAAVYAALFKAVNVTGFVRIPSREQPGTMRDAVRFDLPAGERTLMTWLQLIHDETTDQIALAPRADTPEFARPKQYGLYVREYGLLLAAPDLAPRDAITVDDFAKRYRKPSPTPPKK